MHSLYGLLQFLCIHTVSTPDNHSLLYPPQSADGDCPPRKIFSESADICSRTRLLKPQEDLMRWPVRLHCHSCIASCRAHESHCCARGNMPMIVKLSPNEVRHVSVRSTSLDEEPRKKFMASTIAFMSEERHSDSSFRISDKINVLCSRLWHSSSASLSTAWQSS